MSSVSVLHAELQMMKKREDESNHTEVLIQVKAS